MPNHPHKTTPANIRKFLIRPYKNLDELLTALREAMETRPEGTFLSDGASTVAMGIAAHNVLDAFKKAYDDNDTVDLVADQCSKPYEKLSEATKIAIVNSFLPMLATAVKAINDVDLLTKAMDKVAKTLCEIRDTHTDEGEPYSEDFLKVAKAISKVMGKVVGKVAHPGLIPDGEPGSGGDTCDCPGCQMRRAMKAAGATEKKPEPEASDDGDGVKMEVEHMKLTLDPNKPESWDKEIAKLQVPDEVKQMILSSVKAEYQKKNPTAKMPPPTGFNVDFRRN